MDIRILPSSIANVIAAGEVVERPSSVVKELMENAVDAGADNIAVVISDAGRTLVQVIDNGCGMSPDEAVLCFERHATSKIATAEDLMDIHTFGFRGEALAAIAAVSEVTLRTRREEDEAGCEVFFSDSMHRSTEMVSSPKGTNVAVRNLFYNVPARRKFLKSDNVELKHIISEFTRIALTRPEIGLSLTHNGKDLFVLKPAMSLKFRIQDVLGTGVTNAVVDIKAETSVVKLSGFICRPDLARKGKGNQYFFVNGRYFYSRYLHQAVMKGYDNLITEIELYNKDPLEMDGKRRRKTSAGNYYSDVAYLSTDRLRVHVTNECVFKKEGKGCAFCNIKMVCGKINLDEIKEVVSRHWEERKTSGLDHFLIGGQSPEQSDDTIKTVEAITRIIRGVTRETDNNEDHEIYAMILPREDGLDELRKAGLNQISFNMEIFDDVCARKYMPGKGNYSREYYKKCLLKAQEVWRKNADPYDRNEVYRQIRSMIILGLESDKTFMDGMKWMIENGIQPIISLFRPLKDTPLENFVAPPMLYVFRTYERIQAEIQKKYRYGRGEKRYYLLGPECKCCQNNTLSLPAEIIYEVKK